MDFSERLISLMKSKNLSAYKISKDTGIPQRTIGYWKTGTVPEGDNLLKIAAYLEVTTDYLLGRVDDPRVEVIPADPEKARAHEDWLSQQRDESFRQLAEAIKKLPPNGEQPFTEEDLEIMRKVNNLSPENRARALDYLALLENQDNS